MIKQILLLALGSLVLAGCQQADTPEITQTENEMVETAPIDEVGPNPFLEDYMTPFGAPDFDAIAVSHYRPAFEAAIAAKREEIDAIANTAAQADFDNTIVALERAGALRSIRC